MKITILPKAPGEEDEIIIKCDKPEQSVFGFVNKIQSQGQNQNSKMAFYKEGQICLVEQEELFYFESVDDVVFAYTKDEVFETKSKLYQLEFELPVNKFFRANKAVIVNVDKIKKLSPAFNGRFEATLKNDFKVIISRNYVPKLKELLDLK